MKTLERVLRYIVIGGIFLLPFVCLIVSSSMFFPYITGKNFAFRIIVEVITGAWLALALVKHEYRPRRSWVLAALAVFVLIIGIADVQGVMPFKSIWSNYERMDGWITLIHLLAYVIVAMSVFTSEKLWRALLRVSLGVSVVLSIYGLLQVAGELTLGSGGVGNITSRIDATFGNPIYLAAYMLFHIFIAALLWRQEWTERGSGRRLPISIAYGAIILLDTMVLLFTGTRGTMLGLIGGGMLALVIYALSGEASRRFRMFTGGAVVAVAILGIVLVAARDTAFVRGVPFLNRLSSISLQDNTTKARLFNMQIAWQGVKERPLLGWGQENYAIVFDKYYDPRMYAQEPWFDRVHNIVFDWLVAGGFLGLLAYLALLAAAAVAIWRSTFTISERSILIGLLAGYFVHNLFVFDNITSYILFGTMLAYIVFRAEEPGKLVLSEEPLSRVHLPYTALAGALFVVITVPGVNGNAITANRILLQAFVQQPAGVLQNLQLFEQAISLKTYGTQEAREQLAQAADQVAVANGIPVSQKQQFVSTAIQEMQAQAALSPLDARFPLFIGAMFDAAGDYVNAGVALEKAHELSPKKQSIIIQLALNADRRSDREYSLEYFKEAYELETTNNDARLYYAAALIAANREPEADALLQPLVASGAAADTRVLSAYVSKKEYAKAIPLWEARVSATPDDPQSYFTLAAIYYEAGDRAHSITTLQEAAQRIPSVAQQANALISQIRNGTVRI